MTKMLNIKIFLIFNIIVFQISGFLSCTDLKSDYMNNNLKNIADPASSKDSLLNALSNLKEVNENSTFWADIANSDRFNNDHRRRAVFMLFKRHVKPKIRLKELGEILNHPTWLQFENIHIIKELTGEIPVEFNLNNTAILINIFPDLPDGQYERWAIYLSIEGKISVEDFYKIISSGGKKVMKELRERKLLEFGLSPDTPEMNH